MGMTHDNELNALLKERDQPTPESISLMLRKQIGTAYKAFKKVGKDGWAVGTPLSERDATALIMYYAAQGNPHAKKLAENRSTVTESPQKEKENTTPVEGTPAESVTENKEIKPSRLSLLDVVFWFTVCLTGWGFYTFFGVWGIGVWIVYALIAIHAMIMAQNPRLRSTARAGLAAVVGLEIIAFCVHFAMFNLAIWRIGGDLKRGEILPFRIFEHLDYPFYIAVVFAAILSAGNIYAVSVKMNITKELSK